MEAGSHLGPKVQRSHVAVLKPCPGVQSRLPFHSQSTLVAAWRASCWLTLAPDVSPRPVRPPLVSDFSHARWLSPCMPLCQSPACFRECRGVFKCRAIAVVQAGMAPSFCEKPSSGACFALRKPSMKRKSASGSLAVGSQLGWTSS